jgi:hypothetical protein
MRLPLASALVVAAAAAFATDLRAQPSSPPKEAEASRKRNWLKPTAISAITVGATGSLALGMMQLSETRISDGLLGSAGGALGAMPGLYLFQLELGLESPNFAMGITIPFELGITALGAAGGTALSAKAFGEDRGLSGFGGALLGSVVTTPIAALVSLKLHQLGIKNEVINMFVAGSIVGFGASAGYAMAGTP